VQFSLQRSPITVDGLGSQFDAKPLKAFIEFADGLLFVNSLIALQALDRGVGCIRDRIRQLSLATACGAFQQQRLAQLRRQING